MSVMNDTLLLTLVTMVLTRWFTGLFVGPSWNREVEAV